MVVCFLIMLLLLLPLMMVMKMAKMTIMTNIRTMIMEVVFVAMLLLVVSGVDNDVAVDGDNDDCHGVGDSG